MKLYLPEIGDQLQLIKSWQFILHPERRNSSIANLLHLKEHSGWDYAPVDPNSPPTKYRQTISYCGWFNTLEYPYPDNNDREEWNNWRNQIKDKLIPELRVSFPSGTILKVDRIYVRKGASGFSSITFNAKNLECIDGVFRTTTKKAKSLRFWAKLGECNEIEFLKVE